jgi:4-diphosphocytidyl-2-C-methyl-D-erythritol kinase
VSASASLRIKTHAKCNLFLRVLGRRPDGYHQVETILHGIGLADEIELREIAGTALEIDMRWGEGSGGKLPELEDNLVWRAARHVQEQARERRGASIRVTKHVPMGSGLGGGSANAAGVLLTLGELWCGAMSAPEIAAAATSLGSDVAYFLSGGTALATGRGEELTPLACSGVVWFVLGIFERPLLTADVYRAWDSAGATSVDSAPMVMALGAGDVAEVASLLHNDLEPAAFGLRPELAAAKRALLDGGALGASLSGSGPTVFGIARNQRHADAVAARVARVFDRVVVTSSSGVSIERLD